MWPFPDFQYGFRFSPSTVDLLTVVSDRIDRTFNLELLGHAIYPRLLTGFGMLVFSTNLSLKEFQVRHFRPFFFSQ